MTVVRSAGTPQELNAWYNQRMSGKLADIKERVIPVLKKHNAVEAYVFGSAARGEARPDSDIDILVRFDQIRGLFEFVRTKLDLEDALGGRTVDLVHLDALRPEFREDVERERVQIL